MNLKHRYNSLNFIWYSLFISSIMFSSCESSVQDPWFKQYKKEITQTANQEADSLDIQQDLRGPIIKKYFADGRVIKKELFRNDTMIMSRTLYGPQSLELRTEYWPSGALGFEGIALRDTFYGLSTWYHENGNISLQGIRYKNAKVGKWYYWNENGTLKKTEEFGEEHLIDSLQQVGQ
ncbi:hypothetical protein GYB22_07415 [bacterium]|nr:hypothetical protein [bacterium]